MAEAKPQSLTLETSNGRLRVAFHWQRDRFVQQLFVDSVEAGNSIEGDAQFAWPSSPPLQQLSLEEINGSKVILGVGAAGQGHWSTKMKVPTRSSLNWPVGPSSSHRFLAAPIGSMIRSC